MADRAATAFVGDSVVGSFHSRASVGDALTEP